MDRSDYPIHRHFQETIDFIEDAMRKGTNVLVLWHAGRSCIYIRSLQFDYCTVACFILKWPLRLNSGHDQ